MRIGIFTRGVETHSYKYEQAFANGLRSHGHTVLDYCWNSEPEDIDLAVIWSIKNTHMLNYLKERNIDYVVLERGYIGDREKWTSCGFNGLNGHANFCNKNSGSRRLEHVEKYMKPIRKWEDRGDYFLIMGQVPSDSSVKHIGFDNWLNHTYNQLRKLVDYKIYYRPHPLNIEPYVPPGLDVIKGDLQQAIGKAIQVITLNSNTGVDSVLAGVSCVADDKGSMVYELTRISKPHNLFGALPDRMQWLKDMSYTQWTIEEMESGETWNHLKKRYEK